MMENSISKSEWLFLIICLLLGIIAEQCFFIKAEIGISYPVFIAAFYSVFFWKFRGFSFSHQRFGYLVLICIWLLSASYFTHFTELFYGLNILVIPGLVFFHIVLITSSKKLQWNRLSFVSYLFIKLIDAVRYNALFTVRVQKSAQQGVNENKFSVIKRIIIGAIITVPVLIVVLPLLMSADSQFKRLVGRFPDWFNHFDAETAVRIIFVLISTVVFFGVLQVLLKKQLKVAEIDSNKRLFQMDGVIAVTILILMNIVYILFTFVQFKYFFGGSLQGDYTYAEYARKGFFELLFVTVINLSLTVVILTFVQSASKSLCRLCQSLLTILVLLSAVILSSAFLRLGMYEEAYGFTFTRILAHSFMIFLGVIFAYTLAKIWIVKLSLFHFYFITAIIYYAAINTVDLNQIVVSKNIDRYKASGKIDIQYLNSLSYTGILGLISLYEKRENIPNLTSILEQRQHELNNKSETWQSYNLKSQQTKAVLERLELR